MLSLFSSLWQLFWKVLTCYNSISIMSARIKVQKAPKTNSLFSERSVVTVWSQGKGLCPKATKISVLLDLTHNSTSQSAGLVMCSNDLAWERMQSVATGKTLRRWAALWSQQKKKKKNAEALQTEMRIKWTEVKEALSLCRCATNFLVNTPGCFMEVYRTRVCVQMMAKYTTPLVKTNNCLVFIL